MDEFLGKLMTLDDYLNPMRDYLAQEDDVCLNELYMLGTPFFLDSWKLAGNLHLEKENWLHDFHSVQIVFQVQLMEMQDSNI